MGVIFEPLTSKLMLIPDGQSSEPIPIVYGDSQTQGSLIYLITNNGLKANQQYILTDYHTKYIQPVTGKLKIGDADFGIDPSTKYEPLLITAINENSIFNEVRSVLTGCEDETLYYDYSNNDASDSLKGHNNRGTLTYTPEELYRPGIITRRVDTINNIDLPFDYKNVVFARFKPSYKVKTFAGDIVNIENYEGQESYLKGNFYTYPTTADDIYYCTNNSPSSTPITNQSSFIRFYKSTPSYNYNEYWYTDDIPLIFFIHNIFQTNTFNTPNLALWFLIDLENYIEVKPFNNAKNFFLLQDDAYELQNFSANNIINADINGVFNRNNIFGDLTHLDIYTNVTNNTFLSISDFENEMNAIQDNIILSDIGQTTFTGLQRNFIDFDGGIYNVTSNYFPLICNYFGEGVYFQENFIKARFTSNILYSFITFYSNEIGDAFSTNFIKGTVNGNKFGVNFANNKLNGDFISNNIDDSFMGNTIGTNFKFNTIGKAFGGDGGNIVGDNFQYNTLGSDIHGQTYPDNFQNDAPWKHIGWSWVDKTNALPSDIGAVEEAPKNTKQYARKDGSWTEVESTGVSGDVSLNTVTLPDSLGRLWKLTLPVESTGLPTIQLDFILGTEPTNSAKAGDGSLLLDTLVGDYLKLP